MDIDHAYDSDDAGATHQKHVLTSNAPESSQPLYPTIGQSSRSSNIVDKELESKHHPVPLDLTFPQLNTDGSLGRLIVPDQHTRMLASSSTGARARMAGNLSGSFVEEQYDMIDDLSEISNDDHETASIGSNDQEHGHFASSTESDVEDTISSPMIHSMQELESSEHDATLPSAYHYSVQALRSLSHATDHEVRAANDLIDSYMSEDLETPRQSVAPTTFKSTWQQSMYRAPGEGSEEAQTTNEAQRPRQILFVSEQTATVEVMEIICKYAAAGLDDAVLDPAALSITRLPETPSGISLSPGLVIYDGNKVTANMQHCIGAELRANKSYKLRIQDTDRLHSTFFTVGKSAKIELPQPDLTVLFIEGAYKIKGSWFERAYDAARILGRPILVVLGPSFTHAQSFALRSIGPSSLMVQVHRGEAVTIKDTSKESSRGEIRDCVRILRTGKPAISRKNVAARLVGKFAARPLQTFFLWSTMISIWLYLIVDISSRPVDPMTITAGRRQALHSVLKSGATATPQISDSYDSEHLLPMLSTGCTATRVFGRELISPACATDVRFQSIKPNHFLISLPGQQQFPRVLHTEVSRQNKHNVPFNITKLIDGVYEIDLDNREAYGTIIVRMLTQRPNLNITLSHNFGNRIFHQQTYQDVGTDVSRVVSKDVAIVRHAAHSLRTKLASEICTGVQATTNATTAVALYVAHDLHLLADTARATAAEVTKDFVLIRNDLARFSTDLSTYVHARIASVKDLSRTVLRSRLERSRRQLEDLTDTIAKNLEHSGLYKQLRDQSWRKENCLKNGGACAVDPDAPPTVAAAAQVLDRAKRVLAAAQRKLALDGKQKLTAGDKAARRVERQLKKDVKQHEKAVRKMERRLQQAQARMEL